MRIFKCTILLLSIFLASCEDEPDPDFFYSDQVDTADIGLTFKITAIGDTNTADMLLLPLKRGTGSNGGLGAPVRFPSPVRLSGEDTIEVYSDRSVAPLVIWDKSDWGLRLENIEIPAKLNIQLKRPASRVSATETTIHIPGSLDIISPTEGEVVDYSEPLEIAWAWNNELGIPISDIFKVGSVDFEKNCADSSIGVEPIYRKRDIYSAVSPVSFTMSDLFSNEPLLSPCDLSINLNSDLHFHNLTPASIISDPALAGSGAEIDIKSKTVTIRVQ